MNTPPIIAVDVDGVLADLDTEWLRRYNLESGDNLTPEKLDRWETAELIKPGWKKRFYEILHDERLYTSVYPYPGAWEAIQDLKKLGRVIYLTSTPEEHYLAKLNWLREFDFLGSSRNATFDYYPVRDKWLVGADVLLDDRVENVESFRGHAFLVTRPHNAKLPCTRERIPGVGLDRAAEFLKSRLF